MYLCYMELTAIFSVVFGEILDEILERRLHLAWNTEVVDDIVTT